MKEFDYFSPFYAQEQTAASLLPAIDSLLSGGDACARVIPFGSERQGLLWLESASSAIREARVVYHSEGLVLYSLTYSFREDGSKRSGKGHFFLMAHPRHPNVVILVTLDSGRFLQKGLMPFVKGLHPSLAMTFITHRTLLFLLEECRTSGRFDSFTITRASQRFRYPNQSQGGNAMPVVSWPDLDMKRAFDWVHENNGWFQSLEFDAHRGDRVEVSVGLTREGVLKTDRLLPQMFAAFTDPICDIIQNNVALFGRRSRINSPDNRVRPLELTFEQNAFESVEENGRFIKAMRGMNSSSLSVVHGNPYLHLSIIDYFDGSTFDVWSVEANRLVIVPQMKATIHSIKRLIGHIFDSYAEGKIADFTPCES